MQTENLNVTGMTCNGCVGKVAHALEAINGVKDVAVSLSAGSATVQFDERLTSATELTAAVRGAGYGTDPVVATSQGQNAAGGCCR